MQYVTNVVLPKEKTGLHNDAEVFAAFMEVTGVMWKIANSAWPEEIK